MGVKINPKFVANTLRNCGHDNFTAIGDIADNSLEPEVDASNLNVDFETEGKGKITSIVITDDGCGMNLDILEEALALGSETDKGISNLGGYGIGLNSSSLSMGQTLEVYTKEEDGGINYGLFSIKQTIEECEPVVSEVCSVETNSPQGEFYCKYLGRKEESHGTIVRITDLDKLKYPTVSQFKPKLIKFLGETFNKFIENKLVTIRVDGTVVEAVNLMGEISELMGEEVIEVEGQKIHFKAYYLPNLGNEESTSDDYSKRSYKHQGLYIYRNNRLVGRDVTLSIWGRHPAYNGFRGELYMDAQCDTIFDTTFTKIVNEKKQNGLSQNVMDKLTAKIKPYVDEVKRREINNLAQFQQTDEQYLRELGEFYKGVVEAQNSNMMLDVNRRRGSTGVTNDDQVEKEHKTIKKSPNRKPRAKDKWIHNFKEMPMGKCGEMYLMTYENGEKNMYINTQHPFYTKLYSKLSNELKFKLAQFISCHEIAQQQVHYYSDETVKEIIDWYNTYLANEVGKSLGL